MLQGMFGQRLAKHFSLLESSSIVLGPKGNSQVALTRMRMPNGFPGPTPHIPPERAFSVWVHLHLQFPNGFAIGHQRNYGWCIRCGVGPDSSGIFTWRLCQQDNS
jgi:hypothetical protein